VRIIPLFPRILIASLALCSVPALQAAPGDLYTVDETGGPILRISPNGTKTQFAPGVGSTTAAGAFDRSGNLYICASGAGSILKFAPDATRTTFASGLTSPGALVFDGNGNLFVVDDKTIYKFASNGTRTVFATLSHGVPDMAFDPSGNLFVTQGSDNTVLKLRPDGTSTVFANNIFAPAPGSFLSNGPFGIAVDGDGNVFVSAFIGGAVYKYAPDGSSRTLFAAWATNNSTGDINFDKSGDLFLNAQGDHSIYKITPNGTKTTFASGLGFATWSAWEPARGNSVNLSTRMRVQTGENVLLGGFILTGNDPTTVVIRAIGPSLTSFGIADILPDPVLELHDHSGAVIATNDNARDTQAAELQTYGMLPSNNLESAMIATLQPGTYTTLVRDKNGGTGVGLVEVYDLNGATHSKLVNLSTRGYVEKGSADVMIGGVIIGADGETVLLRAIGPSLANAGVIHPLADPTLSLFDSNGSLIESNDNWKDTHEVAIRATGIAPSNDLESAILTTLTPGAYTAVVQSRDGTTGVALVELYNLN
jgi:sugar lactone lactonase YvrE